jgi:hypothetical protein
VSYARFGADGSDVYVYLDCGGYLCCCACPLGAPWEYETTAAMIEHLREHERAGHTVPAYVFEDLGAAAAANDAWIQEQKRGDRG